MYTPLSATGSQWDVDEKGASGQSDSKIIDDVARQEKIMVAQNMFGFRKIKTNVGNDVNSNSMVNSSYDANRMTSRVSQNNSTISRDV